LQGDFHRSDFERWNAKKANIKLFRKGAKNMSKLTEKLNKPESIVCVCCGREKPGATATRTEYIAARGIRYVCAECMTIKPYTTDNNKAVHKAAGHGQTIGIEGEAMPDSPAAAAAMMQAGYHLIPTHDGSLPAGGIEFKSPIYYNKSGIKSAIHSWCKLVHFDFPTTSQHINVGCRWMNPETLEFLLMWASRIFKALFIRIADDEKEMERICGKSFNEWANWYEDFSNHYSWISIRHDNHIEWRNARIQTPEQYFHLVCMVCDMMECVGTNFIAYRNESTKVIEHKADLTAGKLVRIYDKYRVGKADCQKEKRNNRREHIEK
jgi:hypothetical protein